MPEQVLIAATFIAFLLLFTVIGLYSATKKQTTTADYLLASRSVNPWFTALSAMATGQSGLLFIGQVGFAYRVGISSLWLTIGWAVGDYIAWLLFFQKLRELSEKSNSETVSAFLGQNIDQKTENRVITVISALIILAFLGTYAAAQLVAGSKALNAVFGWNYQLGIIAGAVIVVIYCFSGGIRASIWTDTLQAIIMIASLILLFGVALFTCGGIGELWTQLNAIDANLVRWSPTNLEWGLFPFLLGWVVAGFGVVGQPHIMIRAMALNSPQNMGKARDIKIIFGLITSFSAIGIGLASRVLLPNLLTESDPELALPYLALELFPVVLVGLMLAGLFAATISTADSQILSCSAALTQDLFPQISKSYKWAKIGTLTVTAITLAIALTGNDNVFGLVTFSWSALASSLGPLFIVRVLRKPITTPIAITMIIAGISAALMWNILQLSSAIYEVLPGMLAGILVYLISQLFKSQKPQNS